MAERYHAAATPASPGPGQWNVATIAELAFPHPIQSAWSCNLMEQKEQRLVVDGCRVKFTATP
jgi:hypothetical protein